MSRLNYHHLYYFWQVAKIGNLTKAAKALYISQSALSTQIKLLEERIGHQVFIRQSRKLKIRLSESVCYPRCHVTLSRCSSNP